MNIEIYENKLVALEKEYKARKHSFTIMVENEITTTCFEKNAMADLAVMLELKTQIKTLKTIVSDLRAGEFERP